MDFVKFVGYDRGPHNPAPHIVRALVSGKEAKFLQVHADTFAAVNDQECIAPGYERVITATRHTWEVIAGELDGYARSGDKSPDDMSSSQHHARAWCEAIRVRVLGKDIRYFGLS